MREHGARFGIIITQTTPPDFQEPWITKENNTIFIFKSTCLREIKGISEVLIKTLETVYKSEAKSLNKLAKETRLTDHFCDDYTR